MTFILFRQTSPQTHFEILKRDSKNKEVLSTIISFLIMKAILDGLQNGFLPQKFHITGKHYTTSIKQMIKTAGAKFTFHGYLLLLVPQIEVVQLIDVEL